MILPQETQENKARKHQKSHREEVKHTSKLQLTKDKQRKPKGKAKANKEEEVVLGWLDEQRKKEWCFKEEGVELGNSESKKAEKKR